jgi:Sulfotransferase family
MPRSFVFIVTYGRSGSTLLQHIIGSLSGYHIAGENSNALFGLFQSYSSCVKAKSNGTPNTRRIEDPWFGAHAVKPFHYGQKLAALFISEVLRPPDDARVIGFKEIRYFENPRELEAYLTFMRTFFVPAKFIFNIRTPEEVAKSGWWKNRPEADVIPQVQKWHTMIDDYVRAHPADSFCVRYNDYVSDHLALVPLFEFLGETYDPDQIAKIMAVKLSH